MAWFGDYFDKRTRKRDGTVEYLVGKTVVAKGYINNAGNAPMYGTAFNCGLKEPEAKRLGKKDSLSDAFKALDEAVMEILPKKN